MVHRDGADMGSLILPRQHRAASQQQHALLHRHKRQDDSDSTGVTEVIQTISVVQQLDVDSTGSTFATILTPISIGSSSPAVTTTAALSDATTSAMLSSDATASSTTQSSLSTSQSAVLTSTPSASIPTTSSFASFSVSSNTTSLISSSSLNSLSNSNSTTTTASSSSSFSSSGSSSFTYLVSSSSSVTSSSESSSTISSYSSTSYAYSTSSGTSDGFLGGGTATASLADATSSSAAATSSAASSSGESTPATTTPVIIGSVVSSVAGAAFIIVALIYLWRWKKRSGQMLSLGSGASRAIEDTPRSASAGNGLAAAELDAAPTLQPSDTGLTLRSSFSYAFPAALANLTQKYGKRASQRTERTISSTAGSERGFYRVSGRKLPSVIQHGGDGYGGPDMAEVDGRGTMMSGTSFYRDSQGFHGGPGSPTLPPPGAASTSSQRDSGKPVMRPSPARTPVTEQGFFGPPLAPPTAVPDVLGRSHNDGSHASRFTEEV